MQDSDDGPGGVWRPVEIEEIPIRKFETFTSEFYARCASDERGPKRLSVWPTAPPRRLETIIHREQRSEGCCVTGQPQSACHQR